MREKMNQGRKRENVQKKLKRKKARGKEKIRKEIIYTWSQQISSKVGKKLNING